ncbi:hypothetical protein M407DRAFT_22527 [Tulasnella calospora MUT 4182]|uniref:Uncharacterized protein n=1 Tax=Tulasnella calospora MUT 4182 TaxID=1051891 RepID=A0A0C3QMZ7_9AGAM|nr:hypothetical protein M407DRAFT_22527 [Tulasnella calospora MUT 4182]
MSSTDPIIIDDSPSSTQASDSLPDLATISKNMIARRVTRGSLKRAQQAQPTISTALVKQEEIDVDVTVDPLNGREGSSEPAVQGGSHSVTVGVPIDHGPFSDLAEAFQGTIAW